MKNYFSGGRAVVLNGNPGEETIWRALVLQLEAKGAKLQNQTLVWIKFPVYNSDIISKTQIGDFGWERPRPSSGHETYRGYAGWFALWCGFCEQELSETL